MLEYFDAHLIGLTATPSKQTFGFFNQNLVMEYGHEQAVADGVNVNYDVYRIRTAGHARRAARSRPATTWTCATAQTRKVRWEQLDEDFAYDPNQLDRDVVAVDQIRTIIRTFRDKLFTEIFPGRTEVPKTLIFAKDDSHAEDIVKIVREEFGKGNEFARRSPTAPPAKRRRSLIAAFRNSYHPRIAVTVDMIATGTDIKPLEIVDVHARGEEPHLLRADEGPRRARDLAATTCRASRPTPRPRTTSSSSTAWACASAT